MITMREHAIPQDVTGYRFHIVGSMTLKQFAEVALGVVVAIVLYKTNLIPIVKWPLMFLSFGVGAALAFLPIEERPLDHWFSTFFSILYRPTQFFWRKDAKIPDPFLYKPDPTNEILPEEVDLSPARRQRIQDYLTSVKHTQSIDPWEVEQQQRSQQVLAAFNSVEVASITVTQTAQKPKLQTRVRELQAFTVDQTIADAGVSDSSYISAETPVPDALISSETTAASAQPDQNENNEVASTQTEPEFDFSSTLNNPSITVTRLEQVGVQAQDVANQIIVPLEETVAIQTIKPNTKADNESSETLDVSINNQDVINSPQLISSSPNTVFMVNETTVTNQQPTGQVTHRADLPFPIRPTTPNKVVGMVFTPDGKILPGAIVEIRNLKGEVARAVKTNPLGQFFITTPLESGDYVIVTDKQGYQFANQNLKVTDQILDPVQIISQA